MELTNYHVWRKVTSSLLPSLVNKVWPWWLFCFIFYSSTDQVSWQWLPYSLHAWLLICHMYRVWILTTWLFMLLRIINNYSREFIINFLHMACGRFQYLMNIQLIITCDLAPTDSHIQGLNRDTHTVLSSNLDET